MSLASALSTAQSIFNNTGTQSSVISKNIANAQNPDYIRRSAVVVTGGNGALIGDIVRSSNSPLLRQAIESTGIASGQRALLEGIGEIKDLMGGNDNETSPARLITGFRNDLDAFASKANDLGLGLAVVSSAQDLVTGLNNAADKLQFIRKDADERIGADVTKLNSLLSRFEEANNQVKIATASDGDPNDALDKREGLLKQIAEIVGVTSYVRGDNDMVLYTSEGVTLFETVPRKVAFQPSNAFDASASGKNVYIDGVAVKPGATANTSARGTLQGYLQLRDDIAPTFQAQLDEIARGLITAFTETGADGTATPKAGLFAHRDANGALLADVPPAGAVVPGLAARITVNPAVIPPAGTPDKLRDGGINGAAYVVNTAGSSYGELLDKYNQNLEAPMAFDPDTMLEDAPGLLSFASNSMGWLEELRSGATSADETKTAMLTRMLDAYSSITGVSLDEELSLLLDIEQSYKAGAKLMATVDEMMQALLDMAS